MPAATVTCTTENSSVWVIERADFKHTLMNANDKKMAMYMKVLLDYYIFMKFVWFIVSVS